MPMPLAAAHNRTPRDPWTGGRCYQIKNMQPHASCGLPEELGCQSIAIAVYVSNLCTNELCRSDDRRRSKIPHKSTFVVALARKSGVYQSTFFLRVEFN